MRKGGTIQEHATVTTVRCEDSIVITKRLGTYYSDYGALMFMMLDES